MTSPRFYHVSERAFFSVTADNQRQITDEAITYLGNGDPTGRNPSARWVQVLEAKKAHRLAIEALDAKNRAAERPKPQAHQPPPTRSDRLQAVAASAKTGQGGITATEADAFLASLPPVPHA